MKTFKELREKTLNEGRMKELHGYIERGMSAQQIAKKMKLDVKTIQALMPKKESIEEDRKGEVQEAVKTTHAVIDTADGNKVVGLYSNEKGAKSGIVSAERPPMNIKNKKTLRVVTLTKPLSNKQGDRVLGYSLPKNMDKFPTNTSATQGKRMGESRAYRDAMRGMKGNTKGMATTKKDKDIEATDDDRKAASKNIIMQLRKAADLSTGANIEFERGKGKVDRATAQNVLAKFNRLQKPMDKETFQNSIKSLADIKKILGR
jgi:hypothetical protein